jgi:hypothetical protein
MVAFL